MGFFVGAIGFATPSLTGNMTLVSKVYFPRETLPLSAVLTQSFDSLIGSAVLLLLLPILGFSVIVAMALDRPLDVVVPAAPACSWSCANGSLGCQIPGQILLMFGIFIYSGVYEPSCSTEGTKLMLLNPLTPIVEGMRLAVVQGHNLLQPLTDTGPAGASLEWSPWFLALSAAWGILGLGASAILFHRSEFLFARIF